MFLIFTLLLSSFSYAEPLEVLSVEYRPATQSVSCGLLHQRDLERQKVIREFQYLLQQGKQGQPRALLMSNNLLTNKLFMPHEAWMDLTSDVIIVVRMPDALAVEFQQERNPFLSIDGPGFVWESHSNQLPEELALDFNFTEHTIQITYKIYLNVLCQNGLPFPKIEWTPYVPVN